MLSCEAKSAAFLHIGRRATISPPTTVAQTGWPNSAATCFTADAGQIVAFQMTAPASYPSCPAVQPRLA